jgi:hypothetical protein
LASRTARTEGVNKVKRGQTMRASFDGLADIVVMVV